LELIGHSKDYKALGTVLKCSASVAKNQAEISQAEYEMLKKAAEAKQKAWQEALVAGDNAAAE
jgi:hypothetical protein